MSRNIPADGSVIGSDINKMFVGVKKSWWKVLLSKSIKPHLSSALSKIDADLIDKGVTLSMVKANGLAHYIRPAPENILQAFKYFEVDDLKAVLIGQDPYPHPDYAQGLCFSVPKEKKIPNSLKMIYKALGNNDPEHGDLTNWAEQGILMLNIYLTRTPNIENGDVNGNGGSDKSNLHPFWKPFTEALIKYISQRKKYHGLLLWGRVAEEVAPIGTASMDIFKWGHPSPASTANQKRKNPKNFRYCDHFKKLNDALKAHDRTPIKWVETPVETPNPPIEKKSSSLRIVACTDGGCPKNGNKHAIASYGVYFPKKFEKIENGMAGRKIHGLVPPSILKLLDDEVVASSKNVPPTNNRGELLAFVYAFQEIIDAGIVAPILIITDSEITMKTITTWMWNWYKVKKDFSHKKNSDIVAIIYKQIQKIKELIPTKTLFSKNLGDMNWDGLTIIHQNSHIKKEDIPKEGTIAWEKYHGNQTADDLCNEVLASPKKFSDYKAHKTLL